METSCSVLGGLGQVFNILGEGPVIKNTGGSQDA